MAGLDMAMPVMKSIFSVAMAVYQLHEQAKTNKKLCKCLKLRIELLMDCLKKLENNPEKTRKLEKILTVFLSNVEMAKKWMETYSTNVWWKQFFLAISIYKKYLHISDQLSETAEVLTLHLGIVNREKILKFFKESLWKNISKEIANLEQSFESEIRPVGDKVDSVDRKVDAIGDQVDHGFQEIKALLMGQNGQPWNIKEIPAEELREGKLLSATDSYNMYKGTYNMNLVLIKVMMGELETDNEVVKKTFWEECEIMKKCESPNILQVFGICIDNTCEGPRYSLVMEYCEKGTLRDMLQAEKDLSWEQKLAMALDAASALYCLHRKVTNAIYHSGRNRVHQSEKKTILHRSLSSRKYLVKGYNLKLSGFEFSKTESSMRRNPDKKPKEVELAYYAPEVLASVEYDEHSEIFSLGVVIYEIVTGSLPLQGHFLSDFHGNTEVIYKNLCSEVMAGLQISCPSVLCGIIKDCLQSDPKKRPNAGDIANRLVAEPEPQVPVMETMV